MLGTIVNTAAVVVGAGIGLLVKKGISRELSDTCMRVMGLATSLIGLTNLLPLMLTSDGSGKLVAGGGLLLLVSLVVGTTVGELLRLETWVERLSLFAERRFKLDGFSKGFVTASLLYCVGAMAIIGSFNDGLYGNHSILFVKSVMDAISGFFLASTLGVGVLFAALPVLLYQGALTLGAGLIAPLLSQSAMDDMCMAGFALIIVIGLNMMGITKFKTTNMLPSMLVILLVRLIPWF
ncbi:MAG: DUF554 domain-containing protein [Oscillospiraceae bacterium]